jgi:hypothetical protein
VTWCHRSSFLARNQHNREMVGFGWVNQRPYSAQ